nr:MAG TPA: hypothetical protein [Caudoviricetes sp.]
MGAGRVPSPAPGRPRRRPAPIYTQGNFKRGYRHENEERYRQRQPIKAAQNPGGYPGAEH